MAGGTKLSLEDELIIALLTTTTAVLLLLATIFGITYLRLRQARTQHTTPDNNAPWNEMVPGLDAQHARGYRMDDAMEQPVVATPYVPLVAQQLAVGGDEGEWESWEGIPSPR